MFENGSYVVYGKRGVCRVEEVGKYFLESMRDSRDYYKLTPVFTKGDTVYIPVENNMYMRKVMTAAEAKACMECIPDVKPDLYRCRQQTQLAAHYQEMMNTYDLRILFSLIKGAYIKKEEAESKNRKMGQVDQRFLRYAEELTYGELAIALETTPEQIKTQVCRQMRICAEA